MSQLLSLKIDDDQRKEKFLNVLCDGYARSILQVIMDKPKSVMEISAEANIPISTAYRRIQTLQDAQMVKITGSISEDGKKFFLYKSKIRALYASLERNQVQIKAVPNYS